MAENRLARRWATAAPYGSAARSAEKESPSNGFAVPAPLRQGGRGDGGADCHSQCTHWLRNDRVLREVRGKNPPVTASPCQPPLGKGAEGTEVADCHSQCAHWLRNDRVSMECGAWQAGDREGRPYRGLQGVPCGRADRGVRPYGWGLDGAVCGGTHGSRPTGRFCRAGPACPAGVRYKVGRWGL